MTAGMSLLASIHLVLKKKFCLLPQKTRAWTISDTISRVYLDSVQTLLPLSHLSPVYLFYGPMGSPYESTTNAEKTMEIYNESSGRLERPCDRRGSEVRPRHITL